jgi:hypothetical protein
MQAYRKLWLVFLAGALMAACAPAQPGQSPEEIQAQIGTSVALTVAARDTQTAAAQPAATMTLTPTSVPFLLPSLTPVFPSPTPFVIAPPSSGGGGGGGTSPQAKYACNVVTRPFDNTEYNPGENFAIKWTIINSGTETWVAGLDLIYFSGPHMASPEDTIELPKLKPNESYFVLLDGTAPNKKGFHVMTWKLQGGWCYPYIAIIVK